MLAVNLALVGILGSFMMWDYYAEWSTHIGEKRTALQEEAKVLLISVLQLEEQGNHAVQSFIDEVCGAMQEATSPGHHIAVQMSSISLQAQAHHRASPAIFSAMKQSVSAADGLASIGQRTIVVGSAKEGDVVVYVSEYLSNIRQILRAQILRRVINIVLVGVALAVILNIVLHQFIAQPLRAMTSTIQRFGQGNLNSRMPFIRTMELGFLADEFDHMARTIETANTERRLRMEKAQMIQKNLLPDLSSIVDIRLTCLFQPAAEIAGDYFDIIRFSDHTLLFCIADVIGHDVPAAMGAAMLKALLKTATEQENKPEKLIYIVHSAFSQVTLEGDFATIMLAHWHPTSRVLTYVSAGQETGYLIRSQSEIQQLKSTGPVMGIQGLAQWSKTRLIITPRDRLVMLTDGIVETLSPQGEVFGRERLMDILEQTRSEPLNTLSEKLMDNITSFRGPTPQTDDMTMLAIELCS